MAPVAHDTYTCAVPGTVRRTSHALTTTCRDRSCGGGDHEDSSGERIAGGNKGEDIKDGEFCGECWTCGGRHRSDMCAVRWRQQLSRAAFRLAKIGESELAIMFATRTGMEQARQRGKPGTEAVAVVELPSPRDAKEKKEKKQGNTKAEAKKRAELEVAMEAAEKAAAQAQIKRAAAQAERERADIERERKRAVAEERRAREKEGGQQEGKWQLQLGDMQRQHKGQLDALQAEVRALQLQMERGATKAQEAQAKQNSEVRAEMSRIADTAGRALDVAKDTEMSMQRRVESAAMQIRKQVNAAIAKLQESGVAVVEERHAHEHESALQALSEAAGEQDEKVQVLEGYIQAVEDRQIEADEWTESEFNIVRQAIENARGESRALRTQIEALEAQLRTACEGTDNEFCTVVRMIESEKMRVDKLILEMETWGSKPV